MSASRTESRPVGAAHSGWVLPAVAALAVGTVVVAAVGLSNLDLGGGRPGTEQPTIGPDDGTGQVTHATNGHVADTFTCPATIPYNFGSGLSPLVAAARGGPRAFADEMGASRFELVGGPDATVLRLGNADGSLASLNTMHERPDGWVLDDMTACDGGDSMLVPTPEAGRLGLHGVEPWPPEVIAGGWSGSVLVDDRQFFNAAGVLSHRSLFAQACVAAVCVAGGDGTVMETDRVPPGQEPTDLTDVFLPDEPLLDRDPAFGLYGVYDMTGRITEVSWADADGRTRPGTTVQGPGWPGTLHLVLAPFDRIAAIVVDRAGGESSRYAVP